MKKRTKMRKAWRPKMPNIAAKALQEGQFRQKKVARKKKKTPRKRKHKSADDLGHPR